MSQVHGLDIAAWEEAEVPTQLAPPPVGVRALQNLDDVATAEAELGGVLGREVELGLGKTGLGWLQGEGRHEVLVPWAPQHTHSRSPRLHTEPYSRGFPAGATG